MNETPNMWAFLIALVVALPPTLTVLFTHLANQRTRRENKKETDGTLDKIHVAVNSNMQASEARLKEATEQLAAARAEARAEIKVMQEAAIADLKAERDKAAAEVKALIPEARRRR